MAERQCKNRLRSRGSPDCEARVGAGSRRVRSVRRRRCIHRSGRPPHEQLRTDRPEKGWRGGRRTLEEPWADPRPDDEIFAAPEPAIHVRRTRPRGRMSSCEAWEVCAYSHGRVDCADKNVCALRMCRREKKIPRMTPRRLGTAGAFSARSSRRWEGSFAWRLVRRRSPLKRFRRRRLSS